jgi:mannose-1-phosphate guanylyltransferase/mannose-6-phosphate isomerase
LSHFSIYPVILSGGSGTRLWPLSRAGYPKQFLPLFDHLSLFQTTLKRLKGIKDSAPALIVSNESHRFIIAEQARNLKINLSGIVLEPAPRNTAPAIALAALKLIKEGKSNDLILALPSDHVFSDEKAFHAAVNLAKVSASEGKLVTFGIKPNKPETGYGYIEVDEILPNGSYHIKKFVEKPDLKTAETYVKEGRYYWNSGMFLFKASVFIDELKKFNPAIVEACQRSIDKAKPDLDFYRVDKEAFESSPSDSIDYAVMEKTSNAVMVPLDAGWNDVGAWPAVWELQDKDGDGNAGRGDYLTEASSNNYIHAEHRLVTLLGVKDLIVIETSDAIMVAHRDKSQDVKKIVDELNKQKRTEGTTHRKIYRPWGSYDAIDAGSRFQVKRITVKPGEKLSLQMHHHRTEHWVVVSGTAKVRIGENTHLAAENESVYIPIATVHSLENPGKVNLELIEIQTGSYLGEDDIVRLDDKYGRV